MKSLIVLCVLTASGCGAILNSKTATVNGPPGTTVDGAPVPTVVSQNASHQVAMPDGRNCVLTSGASVGYIIADIFLTGLIGLIVDAATGDWSVISGAGCPGVIVN